MADNNIIEAGINTYQQVKDNARHNAAMDALTQQYGAVAGDPQAAQAMENYLQSTKMDPLKLQSQQLENTKESTAQNTSAGYRAAQLLKTRANPDGSIPADAFDQTVTPYADMIGLDQAHIAPLKALLSQPGGSDHLDAISQALLGPGQMKGSAAYGTDANGNPVAIETMANGQVRQIPLNGSTPTVVANSQYAGERVKQGGVRLGIQQQNANTSQYRASTTANNSQFGAGPSAPALGGNPAPAQSPAPTQSGGISPQAIETFVKQSGGIDAAIQKAPNDAAAQAIADYWSKKNSGQAPTQPTAQTAPQPLYNTLPPKGRQMAIGQASALANQKTTLGNMNSILDQVDKQIGPFTSGAYSTLNELPGSAATDLKANLKTLSAMGLTTWINSLKNGQGQTGIGRVLQSEANAAMTLYGNMEQDQSPKQLAYHARLFRQTVQDLFSHAQQGFRAQYGVDPESIISTHVPQQSAPQGGTGPQDIVDELRRRGLVK